MPCSVTVGSGEGNIEVGKQRITATNISVESIYALNLNQSKQTQLICVRSCNISNVEYKENLLLSFSISDQNEYLRSKHNLRDTGFYDLKL